MTPRASMMTPLPEIEFSWPFPVARQRIFTIEARAFSFTCSGESRGVCGADGAIEAEATGTAGTGFFVGIGVFAAVVEAFDAATAAELGVFAGVVEAGED